jgi:hypothetical protein
MMSVWAVILAWSLIGIIGTLVMDLLGAAARATKLTHGVPPPLMGKWFRSALRGRVVVADIRTAPGEMGSMAAAMAIHYLIGIVLAVALGVGALALGFATVTAPAALGYGLATTVAAALFMFPAMGFGWFGLKAPREWRVLRTACINHFFYGVGLAACAMLLHHFVGAK